MRRPEGVRGTRRGTRAVDHALVCGAGGVGRAGLAGLVGFVGVVSCGPLDKEYAVFAAVFASALAGGAAVLGE
jgi:hypothetical protein